MLSSGNERETVPIDAHMRVMTPVILHPQFIGQRANARVQEHREEVSVESPEIKRLRWRVKRAKKDRKDESRSSGCGWPDKQKAATIVDPRDRFR